jgi:hypothetical protein
LTGGATIAVEMDYFLHEKKPLINNLNRKLNINAE